MTRNDCKASGQSYDENIIWPEGQPRQCKVCGKTGVATVKTDSGLVRKHKEAKR